jgi:hypothetical protein
MLSIAARSKGAQTWVRQATIVFRFAADGRGASKIGDDNALTL